MDGGIVITVERKKLWFGSNTMGSADIYRPAEIHRLPNADSGGGTLTKGNSSAACVNGVVLYKLDEKTIITQFL